MDGYSSNESFQWIFYVGYFLLRINTTFRKKNITLLTLLLRPFCIFLFFHYHCIKLIAHIIISFLYLTEQNLLFQSKLASIKQQKSYFEKVQSLRVFYNDNINSSSRDESPLTKHWDIYPTLPLFIKDL